MFRTTKFFKTSDLELSGSSINVVKGLSKLGNRCIVIGAIGTDYLGAKVCSDLKELSIDFVHNIENYSTSQTLVFVTPDKERTMLTYIGASKFLGESHLRESDFKNLKFFHLEGYQIRNFKVAEKALKLAKKNHAKISIDLASANLAKEYKQEFLLLIKKYADIVFCNQLEARAIADTDSEEEACNELAKLCDIAIVTKGENGGIVSSRGKTYTFSAKKVQSKDTTGAGDLFTCGFIDAYLRRKPLENCIEFATQVASEVVSVFGVNIPEENWVYLKTER